MVKVEFHVPNNRSARFGLKVQRLLEKMKFKVTTRKYLDDTDEFFLKAIRKKKLEDILGKIPHLKDELKRIEKIGCEVYMRNENGGVLFRIMFREFEDEDEYFGKEEVFTLKDSALVDFYTSPVFNELVNYIVTKLTEDNIELIRKVPEYEVKQPQQPVYEQQPPPQPEPLPPGYMTGITAQQPQPQEYQQYPQQPPPQYPYQQPQYPPVQVEYKICPYCGEYNPPTARFCKRCGSPLP